MQNVLIIGNVTEDIYLRLDNAKNNFEVDQNNTNWLDFSFDGSNHPYYERAAIYGGASITLEVLSRFELTSNISGAPATFIDGELAVKDKSVVYRYILCQDDGVSYVTPSHPRYSTWVEPETEPSWIFIDRSANISYQLSSQILTYLNLHPSTKLAIFVSHHVNQNIDFIQKLISKASLVFADTKLTLPAKDVFTIKSHSISYHEHSVSWDLNNKNNFITHLSAHSTIAASALGAILRGKNPEEILLIARANVQNSKLGNTLNIATLENQISGEYYRVAKEISPKDDPIMETIENAKKLMATGKGILAADESGGSIHKKFDSMNIPDDEQHRRDYRNIFFTTPDLEKYVNGVILFDETARQTSDDGNSFVEYLTAKGTQAGIKVDQGLVNFENSDEKWTDGLSGLSGRLNEYHNMGATFAKWRAAFEVTDHSPSEMAIIRNAEILANYAHECQLEGIVPIVEPELVYDGDYPIEKNIELTGFILDKLFEALKNKEIELKGCILKVNMVLAGKRYHTQSTPEEVGEATAKVLREHVPEELAGVVFLSGGQSVEQATENLQAVTNCGPFPWPVTFSYARALQDPALHAWKGDNANADEARTAFGKRLVANCEALIKK